MTSAKHESWNANQSYSATDALRVKKNGSVPAGMSTDAIWQALSTIPGVGVCVINASGDCVYTSPESKRIYTGDPGFHTEGKSLYDLFPREWADERLSFVRKVIETKQPLAVRQVWRGMQICMLFRPVIEPDGQVVHLLVLSRPTESFSECSDELASVESEFVELGELSVLTPRELVVLALLGQGLTLKEIAERLHRSFKTIDNHRASIGRKLHKTDRLELARLAAQAGLRVEDAELKRIQQKSWAT